MRVLVTRPQPGAERTAGRLRELGLSALVLPLTRVVPLSAAPWPSPLSVDAVAVASANAVRHAPPALLGEIARLPVYAVGHKTGAMARQARLSVADDTAGDAERLVSRIAEALAPGSGVLVLCGRVRRDSLENGLRQAGFSVVPVETYDTLPTAPDDAHIRAALGGRPVDAVLLHSAFAAEELAHILAGGAIAPLFEHAMFIAISRRVASALPQSRHEQVHVAAEPTEEAMLSLLEAGI